MPRHLSIVTPVCEEFGISLWPEIRPVWIQLPPFARNDDPRLIAETDKLATGFFLRDPGNGLGPFGQIGGQSLERLGHVGIAPPIDHVETGIQPIAPGIEY